jgi:hypothetical protein
VSDSQVRRFTLADAMTVIAATAVALLAHRLYHENADRFPAYAHVSVVWYWAIEIGPFLFAGATVLLVLRFRRPRPLATEVFRQPGTVACLTLVACTSVSAGLGIVRRVVVAWVSLRPRDPVEYYLLNIVYNGHAVALAWLVLALARVWRPEPSWIDRAGRAFGALMILLWIVTMVGH